MKRLKIEDIKNIAKKCGFECLFESYKNNKEKLKWKCGNGHIWTTTYKNIKNGSSCPFCQKITIEDANILANQKNGKCLSKEFVDSKKKLEWKCKNNHIWYASYNSIKNGRWCLKCSIQNKNKSISDANNLAKKRNGKCLSKKYIGCKKKIKWKCENNHIWEAPYENIRKGHWCPHCSKNFKKTLDDAKNIAKKRNGKCLSNMYINAMHKMEWQCHKGHIWSASYNSVQQGCWCPQCISHKKQNELAKILEKVLDEKPIINKRPNWLKNPKTKCNLEIDIWFPKSKIAIEYNGEQHYMPIKFFKNISNKDAFNKLEEIQKRDKLKSKLIKKSNMVRHFIIFTYRNTIKYKNVEKIIRKKINGK